MQNAPMHVTIRQATLADSGTVISVLMEAARWLDARGMHMWRDSELEPSATAQSVVDGLFWIAEVEGQSAGVIRFELSDPIFWPDVPDGESAFIHRLAVRRSFAGGATSRVLMAWAAERTRNLGRGWLRLDCEADRPRLRATYERFGFTHHSDRQVGPYFVSRYELRTDSFAPGLGCVPAS